MPSLFPSPSFTLIHRGFESYSTTFSAMRAFTEARTEHMQDEIWIVEHPPVFTLGLGADPTHILDTHGIPVVQTDRGGEVTYHGPGQAVIYLLMNLRHNKNRENVGGRLFVREFVHKIEQAVIDTLAMYHLTGVRRPGAPGIYLSDDSSWCGAKIAALGLKVRGNGYTYHGVSLNVAMDLTPFSWIHPCGYEDLTTVDMKSAGINATLHEVQLALAHNLIAVLKA